MKRQGEPWSARAIARSQEIRSKLEEFNTWRELEQEAGRPFSLQDYFHAHGLCFACEATGLDPRPVGWDGEVALFVDCRECEGTGKIME